MANDDTNETNGPRKFRSPAYPSVTLADAIELAKKVYASQRRQDASLDSLIHSLGYSSQSGASLRAVGALSHYALIEKKNGKYVLTDRALDLLQLGSDDPRYLKGLREAALSPSINVALWERYGATLPADSAIRPFLLRDKGYGENAVADVIQNYRSTFEFAKLGNMGDDSVEEEEQVKPLVNAPETVIKPNSPQVGAAAQYSPPQNIQTVVTQELPILVDHGQVARIPFPMSEDAYDLLMGTLQLWKKKLVSVPIPPTPPAPAPPSPCEFE